MRGQRLVEQVQRGVVLEPGRRHLGGVGQGLRRTHKVPAEPRVVRHVERIALAPTRPQRPGSLPVQPGAATRAHLRPQRVADQLMAELEPGVPLDQQVPAYPLLHVVEDLPRRPVQCRGEQVEVDVRAEHRRPPDGGRSLAGPLAALGHRGPDRLRQRAVRGMRQLGEEQRMPAASRIQLGGPPSPAGCDGVTTPCTYQQIGELNVNLSGMLGAVPPYALRQSRRLLDTINMRDQLQLEAVGIRTAARGAVFRAALKAFLDAHPD